MYVPHLFPQLDLPDIIGLHVPAPLMIQYNDGDELFTSEGQHDADRKIREIYDKSDFPDNYQGRFHAGGHKFDVSMQNEVFEWLEQNLTP